MEQWPAWLAAMGLGLLSAIHPCPMTGNVAALSLLSARAAEPRKAIVAALAYAAGRAAACAAIGSLIASAALSAPASADFLQKHLNRAMGPLLILSGALVAGVFPEGRRLFSISSARAGKMLDAGAGGAFLVGALLALAFCPASAGFFFGTLIPLALREHAPLLLPALFGAASAAPAVVIGLAFAGGVSRLPASVRANPRTSRAIQFAAAAVLTLVGLRFAWIHIFRQLLVR
ncbi:MAG: hypothetical protein FJ224_00785 [Lentisphaerae bacterium]|nr:hypothetical protein [Lentisphaerota bacterium]